MIVLPRAALSLVILLASCASPPPGRGKAFLGALLIHGLGGPPPNSYTVITSGDPTVSAGHRSPIPTPAEADKIDGSGKSPLPTPTDPCPSEPCPGETAA